MIEDETEVVLLGSVTREIAIRAGAAQLRQRPVYGVDRTQGLTSESRYQSSDLSRYKVIEPGMFAYNPMRLNIGSIGYLTEQPSGLVSPDYVVFECDRSRILPEYLYYLTKTSEWQRWTSASGVGSVRTRIYYRELARMPLPLPSLKEQRRIVRLLLAFDEKIETNTQLNKTLESIGDEIFRNNFISARIDDSTLGERMLSTVGDVAEVFGGSTPSTSNETLWNGEIFWATPKDLANLHSPVLLSTERRVTKAGAEQIASGVLPTGTVLLSSRAPIGYRAVTGIPVAINQGFIALRPRSYLSELFFFFWLAHVEDEILSRANGSTFLEISKTNFRTIPIELPPQPLAEQFDRVVRPLFQRIACNEREIATLSSIRDELRERMLSPLSDPSP